MRLTVSLLSVAFVAGCMLDFDEVGPHGGASSAGGGGAGGGPATGGNGAGGAQGCADRAGECMAMPDGFAGVVQLLEGETCSDDSRMFAAAQSITGAPATCGCACAGASAECALPGAQAYKATGCSAATPNVPFAPSSICADVPLVTGTPTRSVKLSGNPTPPECISNDLPPIKPDLEIIAPVEGCSFESTGCDDGETCFSKSRGTLCFYRAADEEQGLECPADLEARTVVLTTEIADTRDCVCSCDSDPLEAKCDTSWKLYGAEDCTAGSDVPATTVPVACEQGNPASNILSALTVSVATVTCGEAAVAPTGEVTAAGLLLCCR